jgi:cytoskeletal protein CcmA (bactofilin family)
LCCAVHFPPGSCYGSPTWGRSLTAKQEGIAVVAGVIGKGLFIKGELHGEEDLIVEGTVEGTITMQKSLTIESGGKIKADITTESITIRGEMEGNLTARDKISIQNGGRLIGDMTAPRIEVEDGAYYKGRIEMVESGGGAPNAMLSKRSKS